MNDVDLKEEVNTVLRLFPAAYRVEDRMGFYIVDGSLEGHRLPIASGKSARKAWHNAAELVRKALKGKRKRGKSPQP